jgi:hypothetical protein
VSSEEVVVPFRAPRKRGSREGLTQGAVTGLDLNEAGSAEVLPIEAINVDPDYQRDLRHDLVNQIARAYDIVKAGPILISEREDGTLWCVDGQHRLAGAAQAGETEVFAHVVHGLTKEQEAELRLARNNRRSDTIQEKFRTRLTMGDPKAHKLLEIVEQHGSHINFSPQSGSGVNAIATLEVIFDIDGTGVWLGRTLWVLQQAFGEAEGEQRPDLRPGLNPDTLSTSMLKAVTWFLSQHVDSREVNQTEFIERLKASGVEDIRRKAVSHKAANGGATWVNFYRALVEMWNFRRSDARKIKWKTIGSITQLGDASTRTGGWDRNRDRH